jgi:hypothetical protein
MTSTDIQPFAGDMEPGERRHAIAMWKHAQQLSRSTLAGDLRGKPEDVYAVVAFAGQFGIAPGNAIQMVWIIKGRIVPRSEFLAAICRRAGHELRFEESSSERCTVAIRRRGDDYWSRVTFTIEDAARAKLTDKDLWRTYTADMLCHATVRRAVKRICPDVLLGVDLGGDEGIDARSYRPLDGPDSDKVVDVELDWDETDPEPDGDADVQGDEHIEDADVIETDAGRDRAMKALMVTAGKAFPCDDAPRGQKARRQRLLRRAAQYAVLGEHRSATTLSEDELRKVENWIHSRFLAATAVTPTTFEILDDDTVRFALGDKTKDVPPPPADDRQAA